jgi:hypothetical protein
MKDLAQIIKDNPGCVAIVDNDCWTLYCKHPDQNPHEYYADIAAHDGWAETNRLASSDDDLKPLGDGGYGSGNCYGGDLLQALAVIVGVKVESV